MSEKIYKPRHFKFRKYEWWFLVFFNAGLILFLLVSFVQMGGLDEVGVFFILLWALIGAFNSIFFHDLLLIEHLSVSRDGFSWTFMFGTISSSWDDVANIKRGRLWGTWLYFKNRPAFVKSKKWGWYMDPFSWPFRQYTYRRIPMGNHWSEASELQDDLKRYAPHLFDDPIDTPKA